MSNPLPTTVEHAIGDFVEKYTVAIGFVESEDNRKPPGDHHGTGSIFSISKVPYLVTCEHVAAFQNYGTLVYSLFGSNDGVAIERIFKLYPYQTDFAYMQFQPALDSVAHSADAIPPNLLAERHAPVEGEYLYVYGFPGEEAYASFGEHQIQGVGAVTHEVGYDPILQNEKPVPQQGFHISVAFNPAYAQLRSGKSGALSRPPGMSGSLVWNTRYKEKTERGETWSVEDMRVTGIVWGASSKAGVLVATPIEHWHSLLPWP